MRRRRSFARVHPMGIACHGARCSPRWPNQHAGKHTALAAVHRCALRASPPSLQVLVY